MKKSILMVSVIAFMTLMAGWCCFADVTGVTDTSKEGSLLIWPLIQTNDGNETYIVITNSEAGGNETRQEYDYLVNIKCYWEARLVPWEESDGNACPIRDSGFMLSINNPYIFRASDGMSINGAEGRVPGIGSGKKGMLKCWAVTMDDAKQISWNHLSGYAIIVHPGDDEPKESAWKYSAWRFAANVVEDENATTFVDGPWVGPTIGDNDWKKNWNRINLWGANKVVGASGACPADTYKVRWNETNYLCVQRANPADCTCDQDTPEEGCFSQPECSKPDGAYDACPQYLLFNFLAEPSEGEGQSGYARNYLALAPCKEDLRGEFDEEDPAEGVVDWYTRLVFQVWNSNEEKLTGTTSCAHCNGRPGSTYDIYLGDLKVGGDSCFEEAVLKTNSGRFKVQGAGGANSVCVGAKATPLVGVMGRRLIRPYDSIDLVGTGGTAAGAIFVGSTKVGGPGFIKWDGGEEEIPERPKR